MPPKNVQRLVCHQQIFRGPICPSKKFPGPNLRQKRTYDWHCCSYYRPQGMEVLPTCLSLFPRDTRLLGSFSAAHDKGVLDYREGVPISPLKKRSNKVFSQGPQPISSSCPLPKVSEARNLFRCESPGSGNFGGSGQSNFSGNTSTFFLRSIAFPPVTMRPTYIMQVDDF